MSRNFTAIALAALLAATGCGSGGEETGKSRGTRKVDPATAATIAGTVAFEGTPPQNPPINMGSDPACGSAPVTSESILVDNGGLQNVFISIKDDLGSQYAFDVPTEPVKLDQKGCHYTPHVLGLRANQPLEVANSDNTLHNVHAMPDTNREFNQGQPVPGMKNTVRFTAPEALIRFKCDVHSWMHAYVGVVDHPYFAVSGSGGSSSSRRFRQGPTHRSRARKARPPDTVDHARREGREDDYFTFKPAV